MVRIVVNGTEKTLDQNTNVSFQQIVDLAGGADGQHVVYRFGPNNNKAGTLHPGNVIDVVEGMQFTVGAPSAGQEQESPAGFGPIDGARRTDTTRPDNQNAPAPSRVAKTATPTGPERQTDANRDGRVDRGGRSGRGKSGDKSAGSK